MYTFNPMQRRAIDTAAKKVLVLAGAGSGKTTLLLARVAHLLAQQQDPGRQPLILTFTQKAASSLRTKANTWKALAEVAPLITTFHAFCFRVLKAHGTRIGLPSSVQLIDAATQRSYIAELLAKLKISRAQLSLSAALTHCLEEEPSRTDPRAAATDALKRAYEERLQANALIDFPQLLHKTLMLLETQADLRTTLQQSLQGILVDEFQDTNLAQYQLLTQLVAPEHHLFLVGDPDQAIYGWRGARNYLARVQSDYPALETLTLEENYRSNRRILYVANALIERDTERIPKSLWTKQHALGEVSVIAAPTDGVERAEIRRSIERLLAQGVAPSAIFVLYRTHLLGRSMEASLRAAGIPVHRAGAPLLDHPALQALLAYLGLFTEHPSDEDLRWILQYPPRGIGLKGVDGMRQRAQACTSPVTLWQWLQTAPSLTKRQEAIVERLLNWQIQMEAALDQASLSDQVNTVFLESGLKAWCDKTVALQEMVQVERGLSCLTRLAEQHAASISEAGASPATTRRNFLEEIAWLKSDPSSMGLLDNAVQLMTLHRVKGLEAPYVFIMGLEEGLLPFAPLKADWRETKAHIAEERRLLYVGITRAQTALTLSYSAQRWGGPPERRRNAPSRFLSELPQEVLR